MHSDVDLDDSDDSIVDDDSDSSGHDGKMVSTVVLSDASGRPSIIEQRFIVESECHGFRLDRFLQKKSVACRAPAFSASSTVTATSKAAARAPTCASTPAKKSAFAALPPSSQRFHATSLSSTATRFLPDRQARRSADPSDGALSFVDADRGASERFPDENCRFVTDSTARHQGLMLVARNPFRRRS